MTQAELRREAEALAAEVLALTFTASPEQRRAAILAALTRVRDAERARCAALARWHANDRGEDGYDADSPYLIAAKSRNRMARVIAAAIERQEGE